MPPSTSSIAVNGTYSIDGGNTISFQINEQFIQGPQCKDDKILFQVTNSQLDAGNHTLEVLYRGDNTTAPLTLCALAATPLEFNIQPSAVPDIGDGDDADHASRISMIWGIASSVSVFLLIFVGSITWMRLRARRAALEKRSSSTESLLPSFHPLFGFVDMDKRSSAALGSRPASLMAPSDVSAAPPIRNDQDIGTVPGGTNTSPRSSRLELRPPSYRTTSTLPDL